MLDTSGKPCPQPIILTKSKFNDLLSGDKLLVVATDPSFALDCRVFAGQGGHSLLQSWQEDKKFYFLLEKN